MVITVETVVLVVGFLSTLLVIYSNLRKFRSDAQTKIESDQTKFKQEVEWRVSTDAKLDAVLKNSAEAKASQLKNEQEIIQMKHEIKSLQNEVGQLKAEIGLLKTQLQTQKSG